MPGEPQLSSPEQELSPFAEKIRFLLSEFINKHEQFFSTERIEATVEKIVIFSSDTLESIYRGLSDPSESGENYRKAKEKIDDYINFAHQIDMYLDAVREDISNLGLAIKNKNTIFNGDTILQSGLTEYISQLEVQTELASSLIKPSLEDIKSVVEQMDEIQADLRESFASDIIYGGIDDLRFSLSRTYSLIVTQYNQIKHFMQTDIFKNFISGEHIRINTIFEEELEKIQSESPRTDLLEKVAEAKELQEPWEKQLDPLYEAGILEYIR